MSNNNRIVRELPLSHTIYLDNEIDAEKAKKLVVYHYPLNKSYRWKEWQEHLDTELSNRYYPYLMRSYKGQFGLFVAVDSETTKPPVILNKDGMDILPEKVQYSAEMNPIWIRLIMRKVSAFGSHCKGSHTLGRPLLKIDTWNTKKSTGVNAISLDCRGGIGRPTFRSSPGTTERSGTAYGVLLNQPYRAEAWTNVRMVRYARPPS